MAKEATGWRKMDLLGEEYASLVRDCGIGSSIGDRSPRQIEIANEIVAGTQRFMYKIAQDMLYGNGWSIPVGAGERRTLSLAERKHVLEIEDLVHDGSIGVLESLARYDPSLGSISGFIAFNAAASMYREGSRNSIVRLPTWIYDTSLSVMRKAKPGRLNKLRALTEPIPIKGRDKPLRLNGDSAAVIYLGVTGRYKSMHDKAVERGEMDSPAHDTFEGRYLADEESLTPEEQAENLKLDERTRKVLETLTPRSEKILKMRFGIGDEAKGISQDGDKTLEEVGQDFLFTRERIRQIEAKALRKLRHPSRAKRLRGFME